jgi:uncharacterized protein (TIGR02444 family)
MTIATAAAALCAPLIPGSGDDVGQEPAFESRNLVLEQQLALFQALQPQLVERRLLGDAGDHLVEIAMLDFECGKPGPQGFDVVVHDRCPEVARGLYHRLRDTGKCRAMAQRRGGKADGTAFWRFSLEFYARPGVAGALIALQDETQIDVNLVLYGLWFGLSGRGRLDDAEFAAAERETRTLRVEIVAPLRRLRRRLGGFAEPDLRVLYEAFKRLELAAERTVQHRLAARAGPVSRDGPGRRADAAANLALSLRADAAARPEAEVLKEAVAAWEEPAALTSSPRARRASHPSA